MGRSGNGLMLVFRVLRALLSIVVLGSGAFTTNMFFTFSSAAHHLENSIVILNSTVLQQGLGGRGILVSSMLVAKSEQNTDPVATITSILVPVLQHFQEPPFRAAVMIVVGMWSTCVTVYFPTTYKTDNKSMFNKRRFRVSIEIFTCILWLGASTCATMLALQYGPLAMPGGKEIIIIFDALQTSIKAGLQNLSSDQPDIVRSLSVVAQLAIVAVLALVTTCSTYICAALSLIAAIVAYCRSGDNKEEVNIRTTNNAGGHIALGPMEACIGAGFEMADQPSRYQLPRKVVFPRRCCHHDQQTLAVYHAV